MTRTVVDDSVKRARDAGRIPIVAGYFTFCGVLTGLGTAAGAIAVGFRLLGGSGNEGRAILAVGALGLLTIGFVRTARLLRQYQRSGGYLALLCLTGSLIQEFSAPTRHWGALTITVFGLALLLLGWNELEQEDGSARGPG
jgi:O-antigen/teichoic acid export membrane protein